jgi:hypothetical protein
MGDAARAAERAKEEVALEKRKGLAEKEAARKARHTAPIFLRPTSSTTSAYPPAL